MTLPPSSRMPTSNETRVRVEALVKIRAQVCPASGWLGCAPRVDFISAARWSRDSSSWELDSSIERNFIFEKRGSAQDELKMENVQGLPAQFLWGVYFRKVRNAVIGDDKKLSVEQLKLIGEALRVGLLTSRSFLMKLRDESLGACRQIGRMEGVRHLRLFAKTLVIARVNLLAWMEKTKGSLKAEPLSLEKGSVQNIIDGLRGLRREYFGPTFLDRVGELSDLKREELKRLVSWILSK